MNIALGQQFGCLTVGDITTRVRERLAVCICQCGAVKTVHPRFLRRSTAKCRCEKLKGKKRATA